MNGTFEYYFRLTRFRNIDLPLQGLYFIQISFDKEVIPGVPLHTVPYSASSNDGARSGNSPPQYRIFPPQISPDDTLQSSGFVIRFSEESAQLFDAFRVSLKDELHFSKFNNDSCIQGSIKAFDKRITIHVDLLFSTGDEVGGVEGILNDDVTTFPTEYTVVASQKYIIQSPGSGAEFFRIPLSLLREQDSQCSDIEFMNGDLYPCAFVEGVCVSILTQIQFPTKSILVELDEFVQRMSREWTTHPFDVQECILRTLTRNFDNFESVVREFEVQLHPESEKPDKVMQSKSVDNSSQLVDEMTRLLSLTLLNWNIFVTNFPVRPRLDKLKGRWRTRLVHTAQRYLRNDGIIRSYSENLREVDQLLFPINVTNIPVLKVTQFGAQSDLGQRVPGAHLIVLVHGYQGSTHDVRLIRNQGMLVAMFLFQVLTSVACLCPDALIYSSSSNEQHTDGNLREMGLRLANEVTSFVEKHSTSFYFIGKISFIAHSLGGLIVRSALPHLNKYKKSFNLFMTLSTPHIGITNRIIESGVLIMNLFKKSEVLEQLTLRDGFSLEDCELYRLASIEGMCWFKRIILVGSSQDRYAPISTSIISGSFNDDNQALLGKRFSSMLRDVSYQTIDVSFDIQDSSSLDSVLGRAAHIKFLESPVLVDLLLLSISDFIEIS